MEDDTTNNEQPPATVKGNPDGSITFHHPIDDVFAHMVKHGHD